MVCFPLGTWVGGMFTAAACRHLAAKGYPITVVTPGNNRAEILRVVSALGPRFAQTILLGYPPFLKDVVDAGIAEGFAWRAQAIRLVLAGEVIGLEQPTVRELVTGKFVLEVREDDDSNRELWIAIELSARGAGAPPGPLRDALAESILAVLLRLNSEFANYVPAARQRPRITLWPTGHPEYFPVGVKHRYSRQPPASR